MALVASLEETDGTDGDTALEAKQTLLLGGMRGTRRSLKGSSNTITRIEKRRIVGLCDVDELVAL